MDFVEAGQRFRFLEDQRARGALSDEQYRTELNTLRVTDAQGRLWMPQERTGQWFVHQNGQWMSAQPPMQTPPPPPPPPVNAPPGRGVMQPVSAQRSRGQAVPAQPVRPQPARPQPARPQPVPPAEKGGGGCGKFLLYLLIWLVCWVIVAIAVFIFAGQEEPMALVGVGAAALLSLVLLLLTLSSSWSGTIVDIRVERVRVSSSDDYDRFENVRFAYVRRSSGRTKKSRAMPDWQVGDRLEKRRGETYAKRYPAQ